MLFDREQIIPLHVDEVYEKKLIKQERKITARMYKRYGDKGFVLNNRPTYQAFRMVKGVAHFVSVALAFFFVFDLLVETFTSHSLHDLINAQSFNQSMAGMGLGLFLISLLIYGALEFLKSIGIAAIFTRYFKPKFRNRRLSWGWILLTSTIFCFSIFASYQGGRIVPKLFDKGIEPEDSRNTGTEITEYLDQAKLLTEQREQLTSGALGYRYGWKAQDNQPFTLNSRGQRKLDQIDETLSLLRKRIIEVETSNSALNKQIQSKHTDKVNRNGIYLASISLIMEILIVISGAWIVWYGVKVEALLTTGKSKREYSLTSTHEDEEPNPSENDQHLGDTDIASSDLSAEKRKMIVQEVYQRLTGEGVKPTWRKVFASIPVEYQESFNEYSVRRYLTQIRKNS